jgi:2-polyprenyl-3-methyl-5-hydroxy-6-metoxy-1,4-benzoquinol methylase
MSLISNVLNPIVWFNAYKYHKAQKQYDKSKYDLELFLYANILRNDMLHYGYFENIDINPDDISIKQFEDAQILYANNIIQQIKNNDGTVLDVGCGMGGLSALMLQKNMTVEALTPNLNQVEYIRKKHPKLKVYHTKFEDFVADKKYKTIINSESLQYIKLHDAFRNVEKDLAEGGRWIIADYFRKAEIATNKSGHVLDKFLAQAAENGWRVVYEQDISLNILPTIKYVNMYAQRFLLPVKHFAFEKLRFKKPWLYYMTSEQQQKVNSKISKELQTINPDIFLNEKKYVLLVLERE